MKIDNNGVQTSTHIVAKVVGTNETIDLLFTSYMNEETVGIYYKKYGENSKKPNPNWTFLTPNGYTAHDYQATFRF